MKLYRLGALPWAETQAIYHALAERRQEGLVLCRPSGRCVCLGLHDDLSQEVDLDFCRKNSIPLIRRDIGGGMVLLAEEQVFFQLILRADNPLLVGHREAFFPKFLEPAIKTLADFGIKAAVKLPADIVVNGKKISGNGAGDINGFSIYTGNILLAFDRATMANILNVPSSKFRDQVRLSMERYLTTVTDELKLTPNYERVEERLICHFASWLKLEEGEYTAELKTVVKEKIQYLTSHEFLSLPGKRSKVRQIKINEGTYTRLHRLPRCLKKNAEDKKVCPSREGTSCLGFAILVVRDRKIEDFAVYKVPCLERNNLDLLGSSLIGREWTESDVKNGLAYWLESEESGTLAVCKDTLLEWVLAR